MKSASLERELQILIGKLCTEWGFCIPPDDAERIVRSDPLTGEEFAVAILRAEGMDPDNELYWSRRIRNRFIDTFGSSFVSTTTYEAGRNVDQSH